MRVAILAGGRGSRLLEETEHTPKPLVRIGGRPIIGHVMQQYARFGFTDFVVAVGERGVEIRRCLEHEATVNGWSVDVVDTGADTQTGGRLKRLAPQLGSSTFMLTWCDGISDVDLGALLEFHRSHGRLATLTAVHPPPRFGRLTLDGDRVTEFAEKAVGDEWINGAFFVLEPDILAYVDGDSTSWEHDSLPRLARAGQLVAYRHTGFWQCMDTLAEKRRLERLVGDGAAPWLRV